jgi:hypothetical protein
MSPGPTIDVATRLQQAVVDLAWSLWGELGVSSWQPRRHRDWAIGLEPLLMLTASVAREDPRLAQEAVDWCATNERFVSRTQYRHVFKAADWPFADDLVWLSSALQRHLRGRWPGASDDAPPLDAVSGKSTAPALERPALLSLRLRALFGVSARAELLQVLLLSAPERTVKELTERVSYTRRQVELDLDMLVAGGLVRRVEWASPARFVLAQRRALTELVGELPRITVRWTPLVHALTGLTHAFGELSKRDLASPETEMRRRVRDLEPPIAHAGLPQPPKPADGDYLERMAQWSVEAFEAVAAGDTSAFLDGRNLLP